MKLNYKPFLKSIPTTSGASRSKKALSFRQTIFLKHKKLSSYRPWSAGRNNSGRIVTLSKGRRLTKSRTHIINRSFRDNSISFIGGFSINPYSKVLSSTVFSGSGSICVIPSSESHKVLSLTFLKTLFFKRSSVYNFILMIRRNLKINSGFYLVLQLPRHSHVSNLEIVPNGGARLSTSPGVSSKLIKIDPRTSLSLVKLPSGVKKIISVFSVGSLGKVSLTESSKINVTSAAFSLKKGIAPRSRGVAKNPVDHPHGGRTKAIKYPRTPWGKTTKFK